MATSPTIIEKMIDPKSFNFQFPAAVFTLFLLSKIIDTFDCAVTTIGTWTIFIVLGWKIAKMVQKYYSNENLSSAKKAVLITGCDTGFGNRLAARLNSLGYTVYATCLNINGPGPQELLKKAKNPKTLKLIQMNVTNDSDVEQAKIEITNSLKKDGEKLWAIVNNAGIAILSYVEWGPLENYQKILDVNMIGMIRVTRAFLPLIRANKGRVINVASVAGRAAAPGMSAYCISKHGVVAFSDSLRREMLPWGVKVITIEPTFHRTPITDKEVNIAAAKRVWSETPEAIRKDYGQEYFDSIVQFMQRDENEDPENVVDAMVNAIGSQEPEVRYYVCGIKYTILCLMCEYLPFSFMDALLKFGGPKGKIAGV